MKQKTDNTFKGKKNYNVVSKINNGLKKDVNEVVIHPSKFEKPKTTSNSNFNNYKTKLLKFHLLLSNPDLIQQLKTLTKILLC